MDILTLVEYLAIMASFVSSASVFYYARKVDVLDKQQKSYLIWIKGLSIISMIMMALLTARYLV